MGLGVGTLNQLIDLTRHGYFGRGSRVIEIGQQQLADSFLGADELLDEVFRLVDAPRVPLGEQVGAENFAARAPLSHPFWRALGCEYAAIDLFGEDVVELDLNRDQVPVDLRGKWDLVVNAGTTEHVANQDNAFRCIHDLACEGGIMIHAVPAQGHLTHGLVNYTPKFFWHLCRENEYETLLLGFSVGRPFSMPANVADFGVHFGEARSLSPDSQITFQNCSIEAILRKPHDRPFVTPLDLPVGS